MAGSGGSEFSVTVGSGATTAVLEPATGAARDAVLLLAHGAGSHMDHPSTLEAAALYRAEGVDVVRFNFLYRARGGGRPDPMPKLTECFEAVAERVRAERAPGRLLAGGRSMGGRAASVMAADGCAFDGLVLLAYPLHPPGRPERLRDEHLGRITAPVLCLNGTRDDLCRRDLMDEVVGRLRGPFTMHWIEGADHAFGVLKRSGRTRRDVLEEVAAASRAWLDGLRGAN